MGPVVRRLENVLSEIKRGLFRPDETRSGRFVPESGCQSQTEVSAGEEAESDSDYVPSSSESEDSDDNPFAAPSESALLWHLVMPHMRPGIHAVPDGIMVFRNNASGVQHLKQPGQMKLLCGRRQTERYTFYAGKPIKGVALCDSCMCSKELQADGDRR